MGRQMITYESVLTALNRKFLWVYGPTEKGCEEKITLKDFRKILMMDAKLTASERKVRELWKLMEDLDFFRKINQSESRFVDLAAVADALGFNDTSRTQSKDTFLDAAEAI